MTERARRLLRHLVAVGILALTARLGSAQGTVVGRVVVKGTNAAASYTVVSATPGARDRFTNADGQFTFAGLGSGRIVIRARKIGYAPLDTAVVVPSGDTLRVTLELSLIRIQLPAVRSVALACGGPGATSDTASNLQLALLFEQLEMNAERHVLLSRLYPFELRVERKITKPEPALEARFIAFDTVARSSNREWHYAPGRLMGTRDIDGGVFAGRWFTVNMPELTDLADPTFLKYHCFDFGGTEVVNGDTLIRVDFIPAAAIHDPDVSGAVFLDRESYQLRQLQLNLVNLSKALKSQIDGQSIRAQFTEVVPGVPMLSFVSSIVIPKSDGKESIEPATEEQRVLSVRFLRGRP
jgi:hypothetical protein